jgi:hypothetical protein
MSSLSRLFCAMACALSLAGPALATPWEIRHNFNLQLNGNGVYQVRWEDGGRASAEGRSDPLVTDTYGDFTRGPAQAPVNWGPDTATAVSGATSAGANSDSEANANGTGFHKVGGQTTLGNPMGILASSSAYSRLFLNTGTRNARGRITWSPFWYADAIGQGRDPIDFSWLDLDDGSTLTDQLWSLDFDLGENTQASWSNGDVSFSGSAGGLEIVMDSPYITSGTGTLRLRFDNGLVTESYTSGVFTGLLPAVGASSSPIAFHFGDVNGDVNIDFDFGGENTNGYNVAAEFGASGSFSEAAPEPTTAVLLGAGLLALGAFRRLRRG